MKKGFTLVEMLVVIAILGILMAMMVPAGGLILSRAKKAQAKSDAGVVVTVMQKYYTEYNRWPGLATNADPQHLTDNAWVMVMSPAPWKPGDPPSADNFKRIIFFEPGGGVLATAGAFAGAFVDPWGRPFQYQVDLDGDGTIGHPSGSGNIRARAIAWSAGPDGEYAFTDGCDNVTGWE